MASWTYNDPDIAYDEAGLPYNAPTPEQPQAIETWVTEPDGTYIAHLDRSEESPFRLFKLSLIRNEPGAGSLEYHPDNQTLADHPTLFNLGNLVWMRYRDTVRTWIIEDERASLAEGSEWRRVSGRGSLQLLGDRLVFPLDFDEGDNLDPATWPSQWKSYINTAAGEMLWDMIAWTNFRFSSQIVRGDIDTTGADGWTQDFRFENLLTDVVKDVTAVHGDVEMAGLTFHYYNAQGSDHTADVVFEEGADLLSLTRDRSDRDTVSYVVGEGVGEGVFAKLAVAERADARRIEGFLAAKDATNVPLLQNLTDATLALNARRETVSFDVDESRFRVFTDFGLGDTVRALGPSLNVDESQRVDAIYLAEDGDRVRVALDLAGLRDGGPELELDDKQKRTASALGVRNRQPQGSLSPFPISDTTYFDTVTASITGLYVPDRMYVTIECRVAIDFDQYPMPVSAAASGGSSVSTSSEAAAHRHRVLRYLSNGATYGLSGDYDMANAGAGAITVSVASSSGQDLYTFDANGAHDHDITIAGHTHSLTAAATKEAYPASHSVTLKVYKLIAAVWTQIGSTISGITDDAPDLDLTAYVTGPGRWRIVLQSAAAQPNDGRLGAHLSGYVLGALKSA